MNGALVHQCVEALTVMQPCSHRGFAECRLQTPLTRISDLGSSLTYQNIKEDKIARQIAN